MRAGKHPALSVICRGPQLMHCFLSLRCFESLPQLLSVGPFANDELPDTSRTAKNTHHHPRVSTWILRKSADGVLEMRIALILVECSRDQSAPAFPPVLSARSLPVRSPACWSGVQSSSISHEIWQPWNRFSPTAVVWLR